ncbi:MAG: leucine-rich repeat protein [Tannerella sp.]|jgi:hypothetical protein|nr:leucine-rich repeat protein [Tannerella sp.]
MKKMIFILMGLLPGSTLLCSARTMLEVTRSYHIEVPDPTDQRPNNTKWIVNPDGGGVEDALKTQGFSADEIKAISDLTITTAAGVRLEVADFTFLNAMPSLTSLNLSAAAVTGVEERATNNGLPRNIFQDNATVKHIVFPENLTSFSRDMFSNSALEGVIHIPKNVANLVEYNLFFGGSRGITGFTVDAANPYLKAVDGVLYSKDDSLLLVYPYGKQDRTFAIPEGVKTIGTNAFGWNDFLEELTFSSTVRELVDTRNLQFMQYSTAVREFHVAEGNPVFATTGGFLVNTATGTLMTFPPRKTDETIVIDGSRVKIIPTGYFSMAVATLRNIIFTEGVEEIGYTAFKIGSVNGLPVESVLEYVELPSTLKKINGEAFVGNSNLLQIVCKAATPPELAGNQIFRGSNGTSTRLGVPAASVSAYQNSTQWNRTMNANLNCFTADQIVPYYTIDVVNGAAMQSAAVAGFPVKVTAGEAPGGYAFSRWTSTPEVAFDNTPAGGSFTMPAANITITANYSPKKAFTVTGAITQPGEAPVGGSIYLNAATVSGGKLFHHWEVVEGSGLTVGNPEVVATSFTMIDAPVHIAARYETAYPIDIAGGNAVLEAFAGDVVTVVADKRSERPFVRWSSSTPGVNFADAFSESTTFVMPAAAVAVVAEHE